MLDSGQNVKRPMHQWIVEFLIPFARLVLGKIYNYIFFFFVLHNFLIVKIFKIILVAIRARTTPLIWPGLDMILIVDQTWHGARGAR